MRNIILFLFASILLFACSSNELTMELEDGRIVQAHNYTKLKFSKTDTLVVRAIVSKNTYGVSYSIYGFYRNELPKGTWDSTLFSNYYKAVIR